MTALPQLAIDTLRDPKGTADRIMGWDLDRNTLYMGLFAVSAVNTLLASAPVVLSPGGMDEVMRAAVPILGLLESPLAFFAIVAGTLIVMIQGMFWIATRLGALWAARAA